MKKMQRKYYNSSTNSIGSFPSDIFDYGISHSDIETLPKSDNQEPDIDIGKDLRGWLNQIEERNSKAVTPYEPMKGPKWALDRKIYDFSISNYQEEASHDWQAPSNINYINCICVVRKFIGLPRENRKELLIHLLGFMDAGVNIGGSDKFIYKYSHKPSQIEIYISFDGGGQIKELIKYDYLKNIELRVPLEEGLAYKYIFFEIFGDLNQWDFDKFELSNEILKTSRLIMDIRTPMPIIDNIPTIEFSKFIVEGNSALDYYVKR